MREFERARQETVRYHEELYSSAGRGQAGTWLARPHRLLLDALAIGIVADRIEIDSKGNRRPALIESAISPAAATELLSSAFGAFDVIYQKARPADVREARRGESYTLASTLLTWLATRPASPGSPRGRPPRRPPRDQRGRACRG
jgi:hypothetical protein